MSFLVAFNGQFSPLIRRIDNPSGTVQSVGPIHAMNSVHEFMGILAPIDEATSSRPHRKLDVYQQYTKSYRKQIKLEHAKDIMSSPVKVIHHEAPTLEALKMFKQFGFRHLPVVNDMNLIVGMISDRELLGPIENKLCHEIMIQRLLVSEEHTSINEIAITLLSEKINALPILNRKNEIVGIITLTDILSYVIKSTSFLGSA